MARERLAHVLESDSTRSRSSAPTSRARVSATAPGDRLTWHFVADTVNDFAWATAKNFVWEATRATIPGQGTDSDHMVLPAGSRAAFTPTPDRSLRHALEFYSKLLVPVSVPAAHDGQDGPDTGMEYPMVDHVERGRGGPRDRAQVGPMMVSNNETWYGWMDEGFNQYMNILSAADARGISRRTSTARARATAARAATSMRGR